MQEAGPVQGSGKGKRKVGRELEEGVPAESQRSGLPREDAGVSGMEACEDVRLDEEGHHHFEALDLASTVPKSCSQE